MVHGATMCCACRPQRYFRPFRELQLGGPPGNPCEWEDSDPRWSRMEKHYILPGVSRVGGDTDAALILQLNTERLETGVRFPKRKPSYVEVLRGTQKMSGEMIRFKS